jgi:hypothetical protein
MWFCLHALNRLFIDQWKIMNHQVLWQLHGAQVKADEENETIGSEFDRLKQNTDVILH